MSLNKQTRSTRGPTGPVSKDMNILMLGWELPPHNSGGLGVACYNLSKALALRGASIDFVVPYSAVHPDTDFMTIHSATHLGPLSRYGLLGAYDSKTLRQIGLDEADGADLRDMHSSMVSSRMKPPSSA